jgi:hypothetical protein
MNGSECAAKGTTLNKIAFFLTFTVFSLSGHAATWNVISSMFGESSVYFFDSESTINDGPKVTVWVKQVHDESNLGTDGVASVAYREVFNCANRTYQILQSIEYGKDGTAKGGSPTPSQMAEPVPDSIADGLMKVACQSDFPKLTHQDLYTLASPNDIFSYARKYFSWIALQKNDPAPKGSSVTWYTMVNTLPHAVYFFAADAVVRSNNDVTLWIKYVNDPAFPDSDGSYSTAVRESFDCKNRMMKALAMVTYNKDRFVMAMNQTPQAATQIVPDSWADVAIGTFCLADFPQLNHADLYFPATNNDIYGHASAWFASVAANQTAAAQK